MRQKVMESLGETLKRSRTDSEESMEKSPEKDQMFWSNRIPIRQIWARSRVKMKTARNWWEKAKSMRTSTPRFHVVNLKYARKHHETYGVSNATNEKQIRSELAVVYFWIISIHPVVVYCFFMLNKVSWLYVQKLTSPVDGFMKIMFRF